MTKCLECGVEMVYYEKEEVLHCPICGYSIDYKFKPLPDYIN